MRGTVTGRPVGVSKPEVAKVVSVQIGSIDRAATGFYGNNGSRSACCTVIGAGAIPEWKKRSTRKAEAHDEEVRIQKIYSDFTGKG